MESTSPQTGQVNPFQPNPAQTDAAQADATQTDSADVGAAQTDTSDPVSGAVLTTSDAQDLDPTPTSGEESAQSQPGTAQPEQAAQAEEQQAQSDQTQSDQTQSDQTQSHQEQSEHNEIDPAGSEGSEPTPVNDLPTIEDLAKLGTELDEIDARLAELDNK